MHCACAKSVDEYHGWKCEITDGPCAYYDPDDIQCAIDFGEGPKSEFIYKLRQEVINDKISINKLKEELNLDIISTRNIRKQWLREHELTNK
jgi:hypothetical protein